MARESPAPVRTCVGCRRRDPRTQLLRVVAVPDPDGGPTGLLPDPGRVLPGRGASLHPDLGCLEAAERRRAFPRALRVAGAVDTSLLREHLAAT